jgi:hypothetical protein
MSCYRLLLILRFLHLSVMRLVFMSCYRLVEKKILYFCVFNNKIIYFCVLNNKISKNVMNYIFLQFYIFVYLTIR